MLVKPVECRGCPLDTLGLPHATCHPDKRAHRTGLCRNWYGKETPERHQAQLAANRAWYKRNYTKRQGKHSVAARRDAALWTKYRIRSSDFEAMLSAQGGCCKLCGRRRKLDVDHCHITGRVRGLLCRNCNTWLGRYEALSWIAKVEDYLAA